MFFADIIGQNEVKQHLLLSVKEQRIPHAQLFCGQEGVGKLPLAIAYSRYICCTNRGETDACGVCPSCVKFAKLAHPDLHFVFPIVKPESKTSVVCDNFIVQFREFVLQNPYFHFNDWLDAINDGNKQGTIYANESDEIIRKLNLKTYESEFKVMIIYQPEKMHAACANKLLKILEEPPPKTIFILVADDVENMLATILSRTQRIQIPLIDNQALGDALRKQYELSDAAIESVVRVANGNYLRALDVINSDESSRENLNTFISLMRLAYAKDVSALRNWSNETAKTGREKQKVFLSYAQRMIRENFVFNLRQPNLNYLTNYEADFSSKFSPFINERNIEKLMDELQTAQRHIEQNVQAKMVFFDLALKVVVLLRK